MLLGERLYGKQALEWGLVNRVVPDDEVESAAMDLAKQLAKGPRSLGMIKKIAWAAADVSLEQALTNERLGQRDASRTEDFVEGVTAFAAKRTPEFKGRIGQ
jgi:2-(1,2-epoxy-1,2-dihydrophenyl)acetyl-CoA isomerase